VKITLQAVTRGSVPPATLAAFLRPYAGVDTLTLPADESELVEAAYARHLAPDPRSRAGALAFAIGDRLSVAAVATMHGGRIDRVERMDVASIGGNTLRSLAVVYDDGVTTTMPCDLGDHGPSLVVDDSGRAAFYAWMTSDALHDARIAAARARLSFDVVDRVHEIRDEDLVLLGRDVDPARVRLALGREASAPVASTQASGMTLRQLYATPPSPGGRARLGRR
jgi:hypothetical protein